MNRIIIMYKNIFSIRLKLKFWFDFSVFLNDDGSYKMENWHTDGVHMSELGYEDLQSNIIAPLL